MTLKINIVETHKQLIDNVLHLKINVGMADAYKLIDSDMGSDENKVYNKENIS